MSVLNGDTVTFACSSRERFSISILGGALGFCTPVIYEHVIVYTNNNQKIIEASPSLSCLFDSLSMASMRHGRNEPYMYDRVSFKDWLDEYEIEYENEKNT